MLEVKFKRDSNRNFIILKAPKNTDYQLKMICQNEIKGFLNVHTKIFNGDMDIYYDISSRQPLTRLYASKELKIEDIKTILFSIQALFAEAGKYLLDCSCILLSPEYCYANFENRRVEWIFYPENERDIQFLELAEFFIDRVDHSDAEAVNVAYRFFREVKDDNIMINEFTGSFVTDVAEVEEKDEANIIIPQPVQNHVQYEKPQIEKKQVGIWHKIKDYILSGKKSVSAMPSVNLMQNSAPNNVSAWENYGMKEDEEYSGETVVMGLQKSSAKRQLRNLAPGSTDCISLHSLPCVLGKMEECADIVLKDKTVSRMHAKIYEEGSEVFLQDLNSTNGTYLNGLPLESNEIMKISLGDEIGFGSLRFRYE